MKILIVDDNQESRYFLESLLKKNAFQFKSTSNGLEALELLNSELFNLIISDILMPEMDGYQLCAQIKQTPELASIPFVFYTAVYTDTQDEDLAYKLGAAQYIRKSVEPKEFIQILRDTFKTAKEAQLQSRKTEPAKPETLKLYSERLVKKLEKKILDLNDSERRYNTVFESTGTATLLVNEDMTIELANQEVFKVTGYRTTELKGKKWTNFVNPESLELMIEYHKKRRVAPLSVPKKYEVKLIHKSGKTRFAMLDIGMIPGTKKSVVSMLDVTEQRQTENALKEREEKYRTMFETANDAIFIMQDYRFIDCNDRTLNMFKCTRDDIINKTPNEFSPEKQPDGKNSKKKVLAKINKAFQGEPQRFEWTFNEFIAEVSLNKYAIEDETFIMAIVRDITEHKQAEEEITKARQDWETIFKAVGHPTMIMDKNHSILLVNQAVKDATGLTAEQLIGKKCYHIFHNSQKPPRNCPLQALVTSGKIDTVEMNVESLNGTFLISSTPVLDKAGQIDKIIHVATDITKRKQAEETVKNQLNEITAYYNNIPIGLAIIDTDLRFQRINRMLAEMNGLAIDDHIGKTIGEILPSFENKVKEITKKILETGEPVRDIELVGETEADPGVQHVWSECWYPLKDNTEKITGYNIIVQDITERKQFAAALHESEERLRLANKATNDVIWDMDTVHDTQIWNEGGEIVFGWSEVVNQPQPFTWWSERVHKDDRARVTKSFLDVVHDPARTHWKDEYRFRKADGSYAQVVDRGYVLRDEEGKATRMIGAMQDVTERKKIEKNLRNSEQRLRTLAENVPGVIYLCKNDERWTMIYLNDMVEKLTGYAVKDFLAGQISFVDLYHPDDKEMIFNQVEEALSNKESFDLEYRIKHKSGKWIWIHEVGAGIVENQKIIHLEGFLIDVTKQKEALQKVYESEKQFAAFMDNLPITAFITDANNRYIYFNKEMHKVFNTKNWLGKTVHDIFPPEIAGRIEKADRESFEKGYGVSILTVADKNAHERIWESHTFRIDRKESDALLGGFSIDITEREKARQEIIRNKERLESLLKIIEHRSDDIQALLDFALSEAIKLSQSKIGYIYYYDEIKQQFKLNTWSKDVMDECSIVEPETIYQLEKTGIWGEIVRQRKPIMINNFQAPHPLKKGYPEGHVALFKYLTIPVNIDNHIIAVVGVANKETDYDDIDIQQLTLLMDSVWKVIDRVKTEKEIKDRVEELERFHRVSVGREQQMIELKKKINALSKRLGYKQPYTLSFLKDDKNPSAKE